MKFSLELSKKNNLISAVIILVLLYSYEYGIVSNLAGSYAFSLVTLAVLLILSFLYTIFNKKFLVSNAENLWILVVLFSLYNNQDIKNGTESRWIVFGLGCLLSILLLYYRGWYKLFIDNLKFYTKFHVFFTLLFWIMPTMYYSIVPFLIKGSVNIALIQFEQGNNPGLTAHYSTNGIYLAIGVIVYGAILINKMNSKNFLQFIIVLFALILTRKRAHFVFALVALLIVYFFYESNHKVSRFLKIGLIVSLFLLLFVVGAQFIPAFAGLVERLTGLGLGDDYSNGRMYFWKFAVDLFKNNPLIGVGWGGFKHEYFAQRGNFTPDEQYVDCHNSYLQVLCEQGIIGFLLIFGFVIYILLKTKNMLVYNRKNDVYNDKNITLMISLGIQLFFVIYCLTGNPLYDPQILFPYMISSAVVFCISRERKVNENENRNINIS